jgi:hypothetical protein
MSNRLTGPRPERTRRRPESKILFAGLFLCVGAAVAGNAMSDDSDGSERNASNNPSVNFVTPSTTATTLRVVSERPTTTERVVPPESLATTTTTTSPPETRPSTTTTSTSTTTTTILPPNQPVTGEGDIESWQPLDTPTAAEVCAAGASFDPHPGAEGQEPNETWGDMLVVPADPAHEAKYLFVTDGADAEEAGVLGTAALEGFAIVGSVALGVGPEGGCVAEMDQAGSYLPITITLDVPAGAPRL